MKDYYIDTQDELKMNSRTPEETNNSTPSDEEKPKDPKPSTESSGEIIKPGGDQERNPKKKM